MQLLTKELLKKLPPLYSQENEKDPMVICKFFYPDFSWTWYAIEGEPSVDIYGEPDFEFFGYVDGDEPELGYFTMSELAGNRGKLGCPIERDRYFTPCRLSEIKEKGEK